MTLSGSAGERRENNERRVGELVVQSMGVVTLSVLAPPGDHPGVQLAAEVGGVVSRQGGEGRLTVETRVARDFFTDSWRFLLKRAASFGPGVRWLASVDKK